MEGGFALKFELTIKPRRMMEMWMKCLSAHSSCVRTKARWRTAEVEEGFGHHENFLAADGTHLHLSLSFISSAPGVPNASAGNSDPLSTRHHQALPRPPRPILKFTPAALLSATRLSGRGDDRSWSFFFAGTQSVAKVRT